MADTATGPPGRTRAPRGADAPALARDLRLHDLGFRFTVCAGCPLVDSVVDPLFSWKKPGKSPIWHVFFSFFFFLNFIYFWLRWVFVAVRGLFIAVASRCGARLQ